jgi:hypothetical protein
MEFLSGFYKIFFKKKKMKLTLNNYRKIIQTTKELNLLSTTQEVLLLKSLFQKKELNN